MGLSTHLCFGGCGFESTSLFFFFWGGGGGGGGGGGCGFESFFGFYLDFLGVF